MVQKFLRRIANGAESHKTGTGARHDSRERCILAELTGYDLVEAMNLHRMISEYETILEDLDRQIQDSVISCDEDAKILLSIPGFGLKTTMAVLAYAGDMRRFDNPAQLVNYIGFSPGLYASCDIERTGSIRNVETRRCDGF